MNLFQPEHKNTSLNAYVGNNPWVDINTHITGYQSATIVMLDTILGSNYKQYDGAFSWCNDTSIYPILFCARHFIELYIKQKIYAINFLKLKQDINEKLIKTHDIRKLWKMFVSISNETKDYRIEEFIDSLKPYIDEFGNIDPIGETFRYPYSQDNEKHLLNFQCIGIYNFSKKFKDFSKICGGFTHFMDYLVDEYRVKTFTKVLSRSDIEKIAKKLPTNQEWKNFSFNNIKNEIKKEFNISSNELTKAINIIKGHIEFKQYLYPEVYELPIEKNKLVLFMNETFKESDIDKFSFEEIACLRAICEIGTAFMNVRYYSEDYFWLYKLFLEKYKKGNYYEFKTDYNCIIYNIYRIKLGIEKLNYIHHIQ
ncbi:hypothetical protein [Pelistega ratti]|uniref:hypothetical protein n=1 Tax=Pelistega ratti TaxID=2652177 RepID=UPI00135A7B82|nr:hypothetical protein [Pelistega ratti]